MASGRALRWRSGEEIVEEDETDRSAVAGRAKRNEGFAPYVRMRRAIEIL